jgi:Tol biopolymer transport system component
MKKLFILFVLELLLFNISSFSQSTEYIIFRSNRKDLNVYGLYRIKPDGTDLKRLSPDNITKQEMLGRPNPSGNILAFCSQGSGLYTMNIDGSNIKLITSANGGSPYGITWSIDGNEIIYTNTSTCSEEIYKVNVNGSNNSKYVDASVDVTDPIANQPDISLNGKVVFITQACGEIGRDIYTMNYDKTNLKKIYSGHAYWARWSPDGTKIVAQINSSISNNWSKGDIYTMNSDGTNLVKLTSTDNNATPDWSPDGSKIVYAHFNLYSSKSALRIMKADGSNQVQITDSIADNSWPEWFNTNSFDTLYYYNKGLKAGVKSVDTLVSYNHGFSAGVKSVDTLTIFKHGLASCKSSTKTKSLRYEEISAYPNPTKGIIYIQSDANIGKVNIVDLNGKTLLTQYGKSIDISSFAMGTYFLNIYDSNGNNINDIQIMLVK